MMLMRIFGVSVVLLILSIVAVRCLSELRSSTTQCDLSIWFGNQTIRWCSDGPPNITFQAVNYTGGCNTMPTQGDGGIRLWVNVEKGHVQELVGFTTNNCSASSPMLFLAEPFLKLDYCGALVMFVMLYPIGAMRVNCTTTLS